MTHDLINDEALVFYLMKEGYENITFVPGWGLCGLMRMLYTVGLFYEMDYGGYKGRFCYHTKAEAIDGLNNWDGKGLPGGNWIKHKGDGIDDINPNHEMPNYENF